MEDLISRQAAIDVLEVFTQKDALEHTPRQIIEALPSAQPGTIRCKDSTGFLMMVTATAGAGLQERLKMANGVVGGREVSEKLKPCPFCGGKAQIFIDLIFPRPYFVECAEKSCDVNPRTMRVENEDDAIEAWNRRADDKNGNT